MKTIEWMIIQWLQHYDTVISSVMIFVTQDENVTGESNQQFLKENEKVDCHLHIGPKYPLRFDHTNVTTAVSPTGPYRIWIICPPLN